MNTYHAFYKGKQIELQAETSLKAQTQAATIFHAKKSYQVTVMLVALNGQPITHIATE